MINVTLVEMKQTYLAWRSKLNKIVPLFKSCAKLNYMIVFVVFCHSSTSLNNVTLISTGWSEGKILAGTPPAACDNRRHFTTQAPIDVLPGIWRSRDLTSNRENSWLKTDSPAKSSIPREIMDLSSPQWCLVCLERGDYGILIMTFHDFLSSP